MKVSDAITQYIDYRSNLGEKVRTIRYLLLGFGKYVGLDNELGTITEEKCSIYLGLKGIQDEKATCSFVISAVSGKTSQI